MDEKLSLSWSQIKTWQRCQKQWAYKYQQRLQPIVKQRALYIGSWTHAALESYYKQGDWKIGHNIYVKEWNGLLLEEKQHLMGRKKTEFPELIERIMRSYLWYYRHDNWEVYAVELPFETQLKSGIWINGIIDLIIKITYPDGTVEYWVIDHKTGTNIPESGAFHAMDPQLMVYPWAARKELGIPVTGIIYNYVKSKAPTIPQLTKKTGQISRRKIVTDYPTAYRFLRDNGFDPNDFTDFLRPLRKKSPFLRRYRLPREAVVTKTILSDFYHSSRQIQTLGHGATRHVRNITKDCARFCSYHDICRGELNGGDMTYMKKKYFTLRPKEEHGERSLIEL